MQVSLEGKVAVVDECELRASSHACLLSCNQLHERIPLFGGMQSTAQAAASGLALIMQDYRG